MDFYIESQGFGRDRYGFTPIFTGSFPDFVVKYPEFAKGALRESAILRKVRDDGNLDQVKVELYQQPYNTNYRIEVIIPNRLVWYFSKAPMGLDYEITIIVK